MAIKEYVETALYDRSIVKIAKNMVLIKNSIKVFKRTTC